MTHFKTRERLATARFYLQVFVINSFFRYVNLNGSS